MAEIVWKIGFDENQAKKAGQVAGKAQASSSGGSKKGGGAFAGGLVGGLLGNLLSSVKQLFEPLSAVATLLVAALFPLLKPFLILFLKVGLLMFKWLNKILGTDSSVKGITGTDKKTGETVVGQKGKEMGLTLGKIAGGLLLAAGLIGSMVVAFGVAVPAVIGALASMPFALLAGLAILTVLLTKMAFEFGLLLGAKLAGWIDIMSTTLAGWIDSMATTLASWITDLQTGWNTFVKNFKKGLEVFAKFGREMWNSLVDIVNKSFDVLKGFGTWIWDSITGIFTSAFNVLSGIGTWIKNAVLSYLPFGGGGGGNSVNDGIITPNGDVIRTNPNDFIIATKNPGSLGSGSGSSNINVSINGGLITEEVARDIGQMIQRELNLGGRM